MAVFYSSDLHYLNLFRWAYLSLFYQKGLFEWLKSAELRSTEEFMVETDLESVKEQLCDLKVSLYTKLPELSLRANVMVAGSDLYLYSIFWIRVQSVVITEKCMRVWV